MWAVAAQLAAIYVLSNLPTPLYVIYRQEFGFSQLTLTLIYAVYVIGTLLTMFFLGRLSDQVGRRPVALASLGLAGLSGIVFLVAVSTAWLVVARILSGLAIAPRLDVTGLSRFAGLPRRAHRPIPSPPKLGPWTLGVGCVRWCVCLLERGMRERVGDLFSERV